MCPHTIETYKPKTEAVKIASGLVFTLASTGNAVLSTVNALHEPTAFSIASGIISTVLIAPSTYLTYTAIKKCCVMNHVTCCIQNIVQREQSEELHDTSTEEEVATSSEEVDIESDQS